MNVVCIWKVRFKARNAAYTVKLYSIIRENPVDRTIEEMMNSAGKPNCGIHLFVVHTFHICQIDSLLYEIQTILSIIIYNKIRRLFNFIVFNLFYHGPIRAHLIVG